MKLKQIKGFDDYFVSDEGCVYSTKSGSLKKLAPHKSNNGYLLIGLHQNGYYTKTVHRLVAEAFIPNPLKKNQINHKNGNKEDNSVCNLEYCTPSENQKHRYNVLKQKSHLYGKRGKFSLRHRIIQQIKDGKVIKEYYGSVEAQRITGICCSNIIGCCRNYNNFKSAGGYQWKYKE